MDQIIPFGDPQGFAAGAFKTFRTVSLGNSVNKPSSSVWTSGFIGEHSN
jgi:hypothetical protein